MASGNVVVAGDAWSLQDQIEHLQGLISLSGRDEKALKSVTQRENVQNDQRILELKNDISGTRSALSRMIPDDERILKTAFKEHPSEYRVVREKTCEDARYYMDDRVLEMRRQMESLQCRRLEQEERVSRLVEHLHQIRDRTNVLEAEESKQRLRIVENNLNRTHVKADTAELIRRHYDVILYNLKQDESSCPDLLEKLERAAYKQTQELRNIKLLCLQAQGLRDSLKESLASMEYEMFQAKHDRDVLINHLRKEVEKRMEPEVKKTKQEEAYLGEMKTNKMTDPAETVAVLQAYQKENDKLLEAAKVSDLKLFLTSWKRLSKASRHLEDQLRKKEQQKRRLVADRQRLEAALQQLRYSAGSVEAEEALQREIEASLKEQESVVTSTEKAMQDSGSVLQDVKLGMDSLLERLKTIEIQPKFQFPTGNELLDSLLRCDAGLSHLVADAEAAAEEVGQDMHRILVRLSQPAIKAEDTIVVHKVRIPLEGKKPRTVVTTYIHEDTDTGYGLTRENVRAMSQALIDANTKKKKKRKSQRKGKK